MESYNKLRVIGKGSYGEVWLVKHKRDRKQYVLKKLDVHNASKRERHAAEQEAKLLSKLKHPNIVSYKDSFETDEGHLYIAMGYCEGGDLYARLKEQKSTALDEKQIVEWFVQIAMALQYMHERNILHRDLKTQNIFLTKSKIIKVGDLGIARVLDGSSDMATTLIGTPYYMSPELFSNKPYNHKSDVWALGCCVYEMTTLKHAFNAKDMNSLVYKILRGKMPSMPKQYSTELVNLIKAMLNHNPDRRPSVNRILRDAYIKKNIAMFLESSRKEKEKDKRPSRSSDGSESDSRRRESRDAVDSAAERPKPRKPSRSVPAISVKEEDVEPLQVGPELTPIREEELDNTGESQRSRKKDHRTSSSSNSKNSNRPSSAEQRVFRPQHSAENVVVAVRTSSPNSSLKISNSAHDLEDRDPSPSSKSKHLKNSHSNSELGSNERLNAEPRSRSNSDREGSSKRQGQCPRSREREKDLRSPPSPSPSGRSSKNRSPETRRSEKKSVLDNAQAVSKARPLPSRDNAPVTPRESSDEPKSSRSSRGAGRNGESGYGSGSSSAYCEDGARKRRDSTDMDKSAPNLSARERRRERMDRETPRDPVSARSVDLNRRSLEHDRNRLRAGRGQGSRSEEFSRDVRQNPRPRSAEYKQVPSPHEQLRKSKSTSSSAEPSKHVRQPSMDVDSSSSSSTEELTDVTEQKENRRNIKPKSPMPKPSLIGNIAEVKAAKHYTSGSNNVLKGREPLKATHPQRQPANTQENSSDTEGEEAGKEKEMNNFISCLNTTLMLEKKAPRPHQVGDTIEDDDDDDDIFFEDVEVQPPGGTMYVKRPPKAPSSVQNPGAGDRRGRYGEADIIGPVLEVERAEGTPNQFSVNVSSPGKAERTLTTTGRLWARITDLRKDCIRGLGVEKIKRAYEILDNYDPEELEPQLVHLLGKQNFDIYAGKIWQLKFCEEAAFGLL